MFSGFSILGANDASKLQVKSSWRGLFAQAGLFLEQFDGPVTVFMHVCGDVIEYDLQEGSAISVDPGHIAAFSSASMPQFTTVGNIKAIMFSGEGIYMARFTGPAKLYLHSISRLSLQTAIGGPNRK